ncbi:MFS transporter [Amycolatopsis jiangsuensis]|uniref:MFS family permease n=1 Tax=Amycolatopsis jiangsuensis TaxID=1181879 RepID=A0A840J4T8_9PSEU|nr:MFS transporter [Amycolatopsis jiangsuensis]MBB4688635.1 MFS family permease [Amycolatopsis jiangsuensis]
MAQSGGRAIIVVLASCGLVASFMQTLVVPLIPAFPRLLDTTPTNASWVVTVTLLAAAVITPVSGRLGDLYGKRRVLLASLAVLVAGSVLSAVTSSLALMVAGRGLQGFAMGVIPLGISIMRDELPAERVSGAISLMSATLGVGSAIGLPLAAVVAENTDWHVLFWGSAALGLGCALLILRYVPESPVRQPAPFDYFGAFGLVVGLTCLLLPIVKGGEWGWGSVPTLGFAAAAVLVLAGWGWYQLRRRDPLVDLRVSARRPVLFTNLASILVGFAMYAMALSFPQLLQAPAASGYGLGLTMVEAGLCLAPNGLVMMLLSPVSARLTNRYGPRTTLITGTVVIAIGYVFAILLMDNVVELVVASVIIGAGVGIAYAAMPALIMSSVPVTETASANGLNALMRSVGTSTSSAVMATLLAQLSVTVGALTVPSLTGFRVAFTVAAVAALGGLALTTMVPRIRASVPELVGV